MMIIKNVNIVSMNSRKVDDNQSLLIRNGIIEAIGNEHALESQMKSIEHLYGFVNPYLPDKNLNDEQIKLMAGLAASSNVWNCPTLIANERLANVQKQAEYESEVI